MLSECLASHGERTRVRPLFSGMSRGHRECARWPRMSRTWLLIMYSLLITELIEEVSPLLPKSCHFQDYDRTMFPLGLFPRDACSPKLCADQVRALVIDEDEGQVFKGNLIGEPIQFNRSTILTDIWPGLYRYRPGTP